MKYCSNCGEKLKEKQNFCAGCGKELDNRLTEEEKKGSITNNINLFIHHSNLFWQVTLIFTTALGGFLVFLSQYQAQNMIMGLFGFLLTAGSIYFAVSFRVLKQVALARAINDGLEPSRPHLDQWVAYLFIIWIIGVFYIIILLLGPHFLTASVIINISTVFLIIIWSISLICIWRRFDKIELLRKAIKEYYEK